MIIENNFKTFDEARNRAIDLMGTAPDIKKEGSEFVLHWQASEIYDGKPKKGKQQAGYVTADNTRAFASILKVDGTYLREVKQPIQGREYFTGARGGTYTLAYLSPEEADPRNRTHNFKDFPTRLLYALPLSGLIFFRPTRELSPTEAYTTEGMRIVEAFFGNDRPLFDTLFPETSDEEKEAGIREEEEISGKSIDEISQGRKRDILARLRDRGESDKALEEALAGAYTSPILKEPGRTDFARFLPGEIASVFGIELPDLSSYFAALAALYGTEGAKEIILRINYLSARAFLRYAIYELARTESYARLKEVLSSFAAFYLPPQWESLYLEAILNFFNPFPGETPDEIKGNRIKGDTPKDAETAVLSRYLSIPASSTCDMREISDYLGAPIATIYRAAAYNNKYF